MIAFRATINNLIIYVIFILPLIISFFSKNIFENKKNVSIAIAISTIIEAFLSFILYKYSYSIFSLFTAKEGIINLSVFISRIIFLDSSLYGIKILLPVFLIKRNKKTVIFIFLKITVTVVLSIIGYCFLAIPGLLYSFPLCNIIFDIIFIILFKKS